MDKVEFNIHFDHAYTAKSQSNFEDWFQRMASRVYGKDFELVKAGGPKGDKKCDGRRVSTETIYQCYAPESTTTFASKAKDKIADSFPDVVQFWPNMKEWVFVHNNAGGMSTSASDKLEEVRKAHPQLKIFAVSRSFLKDELHDKLTLQQLIDVYPSALMDFSKVQMEHIRPLLNKIIKERSVNPDCSNFGEIPNESKLDFNALSRDSKFCIKRARPHVNVVDRYFSDMPNPQNASIIQDNMREKYLELKGFGNSPDEIMGKLLVFCGGGDTATVSAAAYVIVTYYLDACDVFENVPQAIQC